MPRLDIYFKFVLWLHIENIEMWIVYRQKTDNGECKIKMNCSYKSSRRDKHLNDQIIIKSTIKISFTNDIWRVLTERNESFLNK